MSSKPILSHPDRRTCAYPGDQEHDHEMCIDVLAEEAERAVTAHRPHYTVTLPDAFAWADRKLTIPAPHTATEIAQVIYAELESVGYAASDIDVTVDLGSGVVKAVWHHGVPLYGAIAGPGVGTAPQTREIKARYLTAGMTVQIHPLGGLRTVAAVDRDGDTVHVRYVDTAAMPYGVEEGVTVVNATCVRCHTTAAAPGVCCSSHGKQLCHLCYRRTHFVEVCVAGCRDCAVEELPVRLRDLGSAR